MKRVLSLFISLSFTMSAVAQGTWSPYASVEENVHFTDVAPSYNYADLSVPAANSGIRVGAYYVHDDQLSAEMTLGVTGVGTPGISQEK